MFRDLSLKERRSFACRRFSPTLGISARILSVARNQLERSFLLAEAVKWQLENKSGML